MHAYISNKMSSQCITIYKRGKYFIETGTAQTFITWVSENERITQYVPKHLIKRIGDFIIKGDMEAATTLWMKVCQIADQAPIKSAKRTIILAFRIAIALMAIYAFLNVLNK